MASRRVTATGKDAQGDITALCGSWGRANKYEAIRHIEAGWHTYYVQDYYGQRADVKVVPGVLGKYLRTDPDASCINNLDNLPNC